MKVKIISLFLCVSLVYCQNQKWLTDCLTAHNDFRASQGKPPLILNETITDVAQAYAEKLSARCSFDHSQNPDYGENLASGYTDCKVSVKQWTDEMTKYDPSKPEYSDDTGHYTQVVWRDTTDLGCGIAPHCEYDYVTVCNYWTPGNYDGEFEDNV